MGFHDAGSNPHFWLQSRSNSDYATTYNLALQPVGGNVGIGTTSPDEKLDITGGYLKFNGGDYGLKGSASLSYNATSDHYFQSGGSTKVTFKADGKVGIGTTAPLIKLDVRGSAYVTGYTVGFSGSPQGNYAYRLTNDAGNSFINVLGGNLGIGTTNPNQKLEVSGGNINIQNGDGGYITWENGSANITVHHNGTGRDLSFKTYNPDNGNNAERMRLDKNGPAYQLTVSKNSGFHEAGLNTFQSSAGAAHQELRIISDAHGGGGRTGDIAFYTANSATATEKMRINSSGKVLIGTTAERGKLTINSSATSGNSNALGIYAASDGGTYTFAQFLLYGTSTVVGSITSNGTTTTYNTSSDYRLKENVVKMTGALDRVSQLKPSRFNFIADADTTVDGFLAHEVQEIVPEAITGQKDEVDEDGNPKYPSFEKYCSRAAILVPVDGEFVNI